MFGPFNPRPRTTTPATTPAAAIRTTSEGVALDLHTQHEDLLVCVWELERMWRLDDRIDLAVRLSASRPRRR